MSSKEWGNITWKFFHTIAERVNESKFPEIKHIMIKIIVNTCNNLPCPECKEHASNIIKQSYTNNIKTKKHYIEFLRQLHNIVNIKLNKKIYSDEEIKNMYINENLSEILFKFKSIYSKNQIAERMITHNLRKKQFLISLLNDLNTIKYAFN
tara:strand:+ start:547 stop:1002 length:456 start_codon:yes stop_codon:yes gene_type:complete